ncbi:M20/M25/M40 family metallo-hydrolase [Thermanaerothrix sp. 4228-RoL]|uniref:M20/M25/M40 family metallo-hydrolase n=3 Tax=Thermanaerothrix TaxID=1077886 RepID=A0ABU3NR51_9CHLR|nr:M20/M25/M40 family metallo-hydrolase [Thermanaerothrix sp. 4228-RoL]MDT8898326.1 M20/M25/M40 family metallo-hydrolase [Thermanaerothrix sp. 4228-RoL]
MPTLSPTLQDEVVALLQALVRTPSLSGQERALADLVEARLRRLSFDHVERDTWGNVIASRQGYAPGPHLLFDAHMDVVAPGEATAWAGGDPYSGRLEGGRVWGRGATDTKGSLAAMLIAIGHLPATEFRGTLTVVASVGEETLEGAALGQVCAQLRPDLVIIGEPTEGRLGIGQKGRAKLWFRAQGRPAHSSTPEEGHNAIYVAAEVVQRIRALPLLTHPILGAGVMEALDIHSEPYPSASTIPYTCLVRYDRRLVVGETPESVLQPYREAFGGREDLTFGFEEVTLSTYTGATLRTPDFHPAWLWAESTPWVQQALASLRAAGLRAETFIAPYCTNASTTAGELGLPTLIYGPSSIALAHKVNEYIEVNDVLAAVLGYQALAKGLREIG